MPRNDLPAAEWEPDPHLGAPYELEIIELEPDEEGAVEANLVRLSAAAPTRRAVLHVHGFADYFFHTEFAQWWAERGYDFYALDLRKYGRSLREHHTAHYIEDLRDYWSELDAAWSRIVERDGHDSVVVSAHSTGGLIVPLWANDRQPVALSAMFLNSPWFDLRGSAWLRSPAARAALAVVGSRQPKRVIPRDVSGFYARSLHRDHDGEFDFDLSFKPLESRPIYVGWLRAVRAGHLELHRGLSVPAPVLVLSSDRTGSPREMGEEVHRTDIVLDVEQIRRWASSVGPHVTSIAIEGARHDVVLSQPDVREVVYSQLDTWLRSYVEN